MIKKEVLTFDKVVKLMKKAKKYSDSNRKYLDSKTNKDIDYAIFVLVSVYSTGITKEVEDCYYYLKKFVSIDSYEENIYKEIKTSSEEYYFTEEQINSIKNISYQYLTDFGDFNKANTKDVLNYLRILDNPNSTKLQIHNAIVILENILEKFYGTFDHEENLFKQINRK